MPTLNSEYQSTYIRAEAAYGDTAATFADGVQVRTVGLVDLASVKRGLIVAGVVKTDANDAGVAPVQGLDEGELKIAFQIAGAARNAQAVVTEDGMSTGLGALVGNRVARANSVCLAACTEVIIKATAHPFVANDIVMIGGVCRRVAVKDSANQFTLDFALPAAPAVDTVIYSCESFDALAAQIKGVGVGVSQVDSEMQFVAKGCNPKSIEVNAFAVGVIGQVTATIQVGNYVCTAITPATSVLGAAGVVTGRGGPGLQIKKANETILSPRTSSATAKIGVAREFDDDIGAAMGKGGIVTGPEDGSLEITCAQDTTLSALEALIGVATVAVIQVGAAISGVWGVYFPEAFLSAAPSPEKIGIRQGVKATFTASRAIIFRG